MIPKILLADEPTGNLDDANKNQILNIFKEANIRGTTVVVATHDRRLIEQSHKRLVTLNKGEIVEQVEKEYNQRRSNPLSVPRLQVMVLAAGPGFSFLGR